MRKSIKRKTVVFLVLLVLFASIANVVDAAYIPPDNVEAIVYNPKMVVVGNTATCSVRITAAGKEIDATLELKQGSTVIASWSDTATGSLTLSGTVTVTSGVTYTLTVSGTIDGIAFTPASITKTP